MTKDRRLKRRAREIARARGVPYATARETLLNPGRESIVDAPSSGLVRGFMPVIPSSDLDVSLQFWRDGLGFRVVDRIERDGVFVWCMLSGPGGFVQLNVRAGDPERPEDYECIRMYWEPADLQALRTHLIELGFDASEVTVRWYGRSEFFVDDRDGFTHCFGVSHGESRNVQEGEATTSRLSE